MKRPLLVSGVSLFISALVFLYFGKTSALVMLFGAAAVFVLYFIKPLKLKGKIIIPFAAVSVIISCISFLIFNSLIYESAVSFAGENTDVAGKVISVEKADDTSVLVTIKTEKIGNAHKTLKINYFCDSENAPGLYDFVSVSDAALYATGGSNSDTTKTVLADGVFLSMYSKNAPKTLWQEKKTPYYYCVKLREKFTEKANTFLNENEAGVLCGMMFGDKSGITEETKSDFRESGASHLLAVSGLHTSLWCGLLLALLTLFHIPEKARSIIAILFLVFFCVISAFTPSVLRASLMTLLVLLSPMFKRRADSLNSLGFAVSTLIITNPYVVASIGFLLSVSATLGVIIATGKTEKIKNISEKVNNRHLKRVTEYVLSSVAVSGFATVFTFPVTAYFFGTFCLIAPLTNILAVKIAFYALIVGFIAAVVSFVPFSIFTDIAFVIFKAASFLINLLLKLLGITASVSFATLPVNRELLFPSLILSVMNLAIGYIIYKHKNSVAVKRTAYCLSAAVLLISIITPVIPNESNCSLSVLSVGNDVSVVVKSGTHFALIGAGKSNDFTYEASDYLPVSSVQTLDTFIINNCNSYTFDNVSYIATHFSPENTVATEFVNTAYKTGKCSLPPGTVIKNNGNFKLTDKINIEIVDTYRMYCVIIYFADKTAVISTYSGNDLSLIYETYGKPDILVLPGDAADSVPHFTDTVVISSGSGILLNESLNNSDNLCREFYRTALDGTVTINI